MVATRNNIFYNLEESPYRLTLDGMTLVFSSEMHRIKFLASMKNNREKINESLSARFGTCVKLDKMSDLVLYAKIEKRGFLVITESEVFKWLDQVQFAGERVMHRD